MTPGAAIELDRDGRLSGELPCLGCGYLLRGLRPGDRCPECAMEARRTIAAQDVRSWPKEWLERLRRGLSLMIAGTGGGIVFMVWFGLCTLFTLSVPNPGFWSAFEPLKKYLFEPGLAAVALAAVGLGVWGMLLITFSDAARAIAPERLWERHAARAGVKVGGALFLILVALLFVIQDYRRDLLFWLWVPMFAAGIWGLWHLLSHMARLAQRLGSENLARHCRGMRWLAALALGLALFESKSVWPVIYWLPIRGKVPWQRMVAVLDSAVLVARGALLVTGILAIHLAFRYRAHVNKCMAG